MEDDLKVRIEAEARANRLASVRRRLLTAWLDLATFSGLESLADPVEDAVDAVSHAWRTAHEEAEGEEAPEEELRAAIEAAVEIDETAEVADE